MTPANALYQLFKTQYLRGSPGNATTVYVTDQFAVFPVITTTTWTITLAQPTKAGIFCAFVLDTDGGTLTLTVTGGYNQGAETTLTFADAGDWVIFYSVKVGASYYWRVLASEGIGELAGGVDIHTLATLAAAPAVSDLLAVSDESATGDPTLAITVTELLSAAGDLTDLAAVPAIDDRIVLTDESATGDPAKSTTTANLMSVLGDLTDLAAVPAGDDRIVLTDESAEGDPAKSTTVANLFSTAGDLTDMAATPALDDRLLVTDESGAGDPAESMSVQNLLNARATAVNSTGVGAKNGASVAAAETGVPGHLMKTVLTCTATPFTFGDEAAQGQFGGTKIYDFPDGLVLFLGGIIDGAMTLIAPAIDTWDGDIGLGVEAPTDHQDAANKGGSVLQKTATTQAVTKVATVDAVTTATVLTESGARWLNGTGTAIDLFLNLLIDDNVAHDNTITGTFTGTVTFSWINLGDLA